MVGDWKGSQYSANGVRHDWFLFMDHDGRYQQENHVEPDHVSYDAGRWECREEGKLLSLISDNGKAEHWKVLSVATYEESNVLLVLSPLILGSRVLPVLLSRVHNKKRGYGT